MLLTKYKLCQIAVYIKEDNEKGGVGNQLFSAKPTSKKTKLVKMENNDTRSNITQCNQMQKNKIRRNKFTMLQEKTRIPRQLKDKLEEILLTFQEQMQNTPENDYGDCLPLEFKLLERIRNSTKYPEKYIKRKKKSFSHSLHEAKTCLDNIESTDSKSCDDL